MSDLAASDLAAALTKSEVLWIELPDRAWPVWHVVAEQTAYVVSGSGEQPLPDLPEDVTLIVRAKDTRAQVGRIPARVHRVEPGTAEWQVATDALAPSRLNAPEGSLVGRWAQSAVVWALVPDLESADTEATRDEPSGAREPAPSPATTDTWHPAHRPIRRRRRHG